MVNPHIMVITDDPMMTTVVEVRTSWPRLGVLKFLTLMLLSQIIVQF